MRRLAAVDIGSNTVHALVADVTGGAEDRHLEDVDHFLEMPELGAAVDRTGEIGAAKRRQAVSALERVTEAARALGPEAVVAGATAAVRRAADGPALLDAASVAIGVPVRLIDEHREAELSFLGAANHHAVRDQWLLADLGGGSTEVVAAIGARALAYASLPMGSGAMAARYLSDPPVRAEREALRAAAVPLLRRAPESDAERFVVTGGTASNLPLLLSPQSPPTVLTTSALLLAEERLDAAPAAEVAARTGIAEARVRALRGGVELLLLLLDYYGLHAIHVSHAGIRQGMILAWLDDPEGWWLPAPD